MSDLKSAPLTPTDTIDTILKDFELSPKYTHDNSVTIAYAEAKAALQQHINEEKLKARIEENERYAKAKIDHRGESAPFNPEGLPVSTPRTNEMTRLLNQTAQDRIAELKNNLKGSNSND
jgi:hypothetical protein